MISKVFIALGILLLGFPIVSQTAETVIYAEGFEANDGGYVFDPALGTTAEWEWGSPSGSVGPGSAHSGSKVWGTDLDNTLDRTAEGSIVSPPILLPTVGPGELLRVRFWGYVAIDGMYDRGEFFVSKDGVSWESLAELFQGMSPDPAAPPRWQKYEFTLDPSYAGGNIYLRFRAAVPYSSSTFFCGGATDLSGFYVDDIAITKFTDTGVSKVFSLEAQEDPSEYASCPWVAPWNGSEYVADNDIYSVARGKDNEFTDHYLLRRPLVAQDSVYPVEVQELESEDSYTDYVALKLVDHAPGVAVAPDQDGDLQAYRPADLVPPTRAVDAKGEDVLPQIVAQDDSGYPAYSGDTVELEYENVDMSAGATLVLRVKGFLMGVGDEKPYVGPPAVVVETQDALGNWQERGRLRPRFDYSVTAFDLTPYLSGSEPIRLRLRAISHSVKYHEIDHVALQAGSQPPVTERLVSPIAATFGSTDISSTLLTVDERRFKMSTGEKFALQFPVLELAPGDVRDFVFVSRGYYIPTSGTYLIYTWDGSDWVMRDAYSYPGSDLTRAFDLSLFLPDPNGELRVRVWQDYQYEPASIDHVSMTVGGIDAPLNYAWDYRYGTSIFDQVVTSDDYSVSWSYCPRDRITEFAFTSPVPPNTPPTTCPVTVSSANPPVISWTYADAESNPQASYEVEVWEGSGRTGSIKWDPPEGTGTNASVTYGGDPLVSGQIYYANVRANDGTDWGQWCEGEFESISENQPPVAQCQNVTVSADSSCQANASVDNGSYDPDGDPITLSQSPAGPYGLGGNSVTLTVTDSNGASASCSATVTVVDTTPPTITSVTASPNTLWPPNHKMVSVKVTATTSDNCTVAPVCTITSVSSNEPENGLGDGDTAPDWEIIPGTSTVKLRAERSGTGTGRVYTVNGPCTDTAGNSALWSTTVTVPHDQGRNR